MELRAFIEPQQGASYAFVLRLARHVEQLGFNGFFTSDHYLKMGDVDGRPGPLDAWTTLAGLARDTTTLRLGTMLTPVTFRLPGPLTVAVTQVDEMSGGRVELGLGAGWYDAEHEALGIPFPPMGERFDRLQETLEIITGLWATPEDEAFTYAGQFFHLTGAPGMLQPHQQPRPPILLGGYGARRTPQLAARFADEFNVPFSGTTEVATQRERVSAACEAAGRDPATMIWSTAQVLCVGADEAELARRAVAIGREVEELRQTGAAGTPAEVVDRLAAFADLGCTRAYLQVLDLADLEHLDLVAAEVAPHLA